jgi:hypothetical protein
MFVCGTEDPTVAGETMHGPADKAGHIFGGWHVPCQHVMTVLCDITTPHMMMPGMHSTCLLSFVWLLWLPV